MNIRIMLFCLMTYIMFSVGVAQNPECDGIAGTRIIHTVGQQSVARIIKEIDCSHEGVRCLLQSDGSVKIIPAANPTTEIDTGISEHRSLLQDTGKPQCKVCIGKGDRYTAHVRYVTRTLLAASPGYWDEDGRWNNPPPDPNISTYHYSCSNDHYWTDHVNRYVVK